MCESHHVAPLEEFKSVLETFSLKIFVLAHWCNMACDDRLDDLTVQNNQAEFLPYEKEDIAVFDWVSHQIGIKVHDYSWQVLPLLCQ